MHNVENAMLFLSRNFTIVYKVILYIDPLPHCYTLQAPTVHPYKHQEAVAFTAYTSNKQKTTFDAPKNIVFLYPPREAPPFTRLHPHL